MSNERRTLQELVTRYQLEPELRDIYVEGKTDKILLEWFLEQRGVKSFAVYEIDTVEIPTQKLFELGLNDSNRSRVIALALEIQKQFTELTHFTCIADKDFDWLFENDYICQHLLFTDYTSLEIYLLNEFILDKFLRLSLRLTELAACKKSQPSILSSSNLYNPIPISYTGITSELNVKIVTMILKYTAGYIPGKKSEGAKFHQIGRFQSKQLPPKVDLRKYMTDVEEQVGNSCVANAFVGAYEYLAKRALGESSNVSRLFVYYNARSLHESEDEDKGTQMELAIDALCKYGACSEELWANEEELILEQPDDLAYEHAANFTIEEAEFVETDLDLWRHTLAEGYPIAFALNTFNSFDEATKNQGRVPMPKSSDNVRETHGWHAMLCVGYSDKDKMFIVRNSWGSQWGSEGYCYIPYDYVIHKDYNGHDSWIIKSVSDLDFSASVWEEDESVFADEGSLLLFDFYVTTSDPEGFATDLENLCQNYVESEEEYYFDYEYEEQDDESFVLNILNFDLTIEDATEFLEELDTLCDEYAIDGDYDYCIDGEDCEEE